MVLVCPKCDGHLFLLGFKSVEVDFCGRCRGIWLDAGALERLMEATGAHAEDPLRRFHTREAAQTVSKRHLCPRCDTALHELVIEEAGRPALTLDRCPKGHGLWFDADELQQLLAFYPADSGASKTIDALNELFGGAVKP